MRTQRTVALWWPEDSWSLLHHCTIWTFYEKVFAISNIKQRLNLFFAGVPSGNEGLKFRQSTFERISLGSVRIIFQTLVCDSHSWNPGLIDMALYYHFENELAVFVLCSACHLKGALDIIKTTKSMCHKLFKVRQQIMVT